MKTKMKWAMPLLRKFELVSETRDGMVNSSDGLDIGS
jgi:hypothetical protein